MRGRIERAGRGSIFVIAVQWDVWWTGLREGDERKIVVGNLIEGPDTNIFEQYNFNILINYEILKL